MTYHGSARDRCIERLTTLVAEGQHLLETVERRRGAVRVSDLFTGRVLSRDPDYDVVDYGAMVQWATRRVTLLDIVIPKDSATRELVEEFKGLRSPRSSVVRHLLARLVAIEDDFRGASWTEDQQCLASCGRGYGRSWDTVSNY